MKLINFIENHWTLIAFFFAEVGVLFAFVKSIHRGTKCSLRNDIVEIYEHCKPTRTITRYQLETVYLSFEEYKKLKGNSFVEKLVKEIEEFKITD